MKKMVSLLLALALLLSSAAALAEAPKTLKILKPAYDADYSAGIVDELEKATNTKLDIVGASWDQWDQKANTLMSVGEEYDIVMINTTTPWMTWAQEGLVTCLDDIVDPERHPYTYKLINSDMYASYAVDGKHYFLPGVHHGQDFVWCVRQDILDEMGISSIETSEQFLEVGRYAKEKYGMYAFAGSSTDGNFEQYQPLFAAFGCGSVHPSERGFVVKDGVVMESSRTENAKNALTFLNTLYREDLINKDYLSLGDSYRDMYTATGKAFSWYAACGVLPGIEKNLKTINESADISLAEPMNKDQHVGRLGWNAMWTLAFIPTTCTDPVAALDFFEYVNSRAGRDLCVAGIPGVTMTEDGVAEDGLFTPIAEGCAKEWGDPQAISPLWNSFMTTVYGYVPAKDYDTFEEAYANRVIYCSTEDIASGNKFTTREALKYGGMFAETSLLNTTSLEIESQVKNTLNTLRAEYWNKIIMEKDPANIDGLWNEYVEKWLASGGTEYEAAYQAFYDANVK